MNFGAKIQIRRFARFRQNSIYGQKLDFWHSVSRNKLVDKSAKKVSIFSLPKWLKWDFFGLFSNTVVINGLGKLINRFRCRMETTSIPSFFCTKIPTRDDGKKLLHHSQDLARWRYTGFFNAPFFSNLHIGCTKLQSFLLCQENKKRYSFIFVLFKYLRNWFWLVCTSIIDVLPLSK